MRFIVLYLICPFFAQLDIVFHFNKVYAVLDEYILAGEITETSKKVILERIADLEKLE
jgi:AP-2 complex subunit sigma-1